MTTHDDDQKAAEEWANLSVGEVPADRLLEPISYLTLWRRDKKMLEEGFLAGVAHARRWIPVTERLPEDGQCIIGAYKGRCVVFGEFNIRNGEPRFTMCEPSMLGTIDPVMYGCSITHWMPLPTEPKERE